MFCPGCASLQSQSEICQTCKTLFTVSKNCKLITKYSPWMLSVFQVPICVAKIYLYFYDYSLWYSHVKTCWQEPTQVWQQVLVPSKKRCVCCKTPANWNGVYCFVCKTQFKVTFVHYDVILRCWVVHHLQWNDRQYIILQFIYVIHPPGS